MAHDAEPCMAGEAGRGFAVVARDSIEAVDKTGKNLEAATSLVSKSGESLLGIVSESVAQGKTGNTHRVSM